MNSNMEAGRELVLMNRYTGKYLKASCLTVEGPGLKTTEFIKDAIWYTRENINDLIAGYPNLMVEWKAVRVSPDALRAVQP